MALYYINIHPDYPYSTIIVGKGGFIPKEYTAKNNWIGPGMNRREFMFNHGRLRDLVDFLFEQDPDDCTIKIRNERSDDWLKLGKDDWIQQTLSIVPRYRPKKE